QVQICKAKERHRKANFKHGSMYHNENRGHACIIAILTPITTGSVPILHFNFRLAATIRSDSISDLPLHFAKLCEKLRELCGKTSPARSLSHVSTTYDSGWF